MEALLDFLSVVDINEFASDPHNRTLTGAFTDAQLELAQNGYQANLVEESQIIGNK